MNRPKPTGPPTEARGLTYDSPVAGGHGPPQHKKAEGLFDKDPRPFLQLHQSQTTRSKTKRKWSNSSRSKQRRLGAYLRKEATYLNSLSVRYLGSIRR